MSASLSRRLAGARWYPPINALAPDEYHGYADRLYVAPDDASLAPADLAMLDEAMAAWRANDPKKIVLELETKTEWASPARIARRR